MASLDIKVPITFEISENTAKTALQIVELYCKNAGAYIDILEQPDGTIKLIYVKAVLK